MRNFRTSALLTLLLSASPLVNAQETSFSFTSSPTAWVTHGITDYPAITPDDGWTFTVQRNFDNGVSFNISRPTSVPPFTSVNSWSLDLAAPFNETLVPGDYLDTARFPFQDTNQPGLTLSSTGRGNNTNGGFFEVLVADYAPNGDVERFAVNFTQYGERNVNNWTTGTLLYNVPEPGSATLLLLGTAAAARRRRSGR